MRKFGINRSGDILTLPEPGEKIVVCHQVGCDGRMDAGLAEQIRTIFPRCYDDYAAFCTGERKHGGRGFGLLGSARICRVYEDLNDDATLYVASIIGHSDVLGDGEQRISYDAVEQAISDVDAICSDETIRIPYGMGSLAGGEWGTMYGIIRKVFTGSRGTGNVEIWHCGLDCK